jgi:hypothetical protein
VPVVAAAVAVVMAVSVSFHVRSCRKFVFRKTRRPGLCLGMGFNILLLFTMNKMPSRQCSRAAQEMGDYLVHRIMVAAGVRAEGAGSVAAGVALGRHRVGALLCCG